MRTIPLTKPSFGEEELANVKKVLASGFVGQGPMTKQFEQAFASYVGAQYGIATNSGTTAIQIALEAVGLQPGDEVIVPAVSFVASANAVVQAKGKPVFVDVDKETYNMDPSQIEQAITAKTKVICPVHLLGIPADLKPIKELCEKHDLILLEDCALAHGAEYRGKKVGAMGDIAIFSFYGSKIMVTGEGGMIVTNNKAYAERASLLRAHGNNPEKKFDHLLFGYSYQFSDIHAAIGLAQLKKLPGFVTKRRTNAQLITKHLSGVKGIQLPVERSQTKNAWFGYPLLLTNTPYDKEKVMQDLAALGVATRPLYYVLPSLSFYKKEYAGSYPNAEYVTERGLFLPCSPALTEEDITYMCDAVKKVVR